MAGGSNPIVATGTRFSTVWPGLISDSKRSRTADTERRRFRRKLPHFREAGGFRSQRQSRRGAGPAERQWPDGARSCKLLMVSLTVRTFRQRVPVRAWRKERLLTRFAAMACLLSFTATQIPCGLVEATELGPSASTAEASVQDDASGYPEGDNGCEHCTCPCFCGSGCAPVLAHRGAPTQHAEAEPSMSLNGFPPSTSLLLAARIFHPPRPLSS